MSSIMSIVVTGFFITSFAYLLCFCCCIMQFFIRRNKERRRRHAAILTGVRTHDSTTGPLQRNDTLKKRFMKQFKDGLKRLSSVGVFNSAFSDQDVSCPICFEEYSGDPAKVFVGYIMRCGHYFHFDCIWKWLENNPNCPLCREEVLLKEDDIKGMTLTDVCEQQHVEPHHQQLPHNLNTTDSSVSIECETDTSKDTPSNRPDELVLRVNCQLPSSSTQRNTLEQSDIAEVHTDHVTKESPSSLGHLSVVNTPDVPLAGTIASGVAYPGCGTHELDVRESVSEYYSEEDDEHEL